MYFLPVLSLTSLAIIIALLPKFFPTYGSAFLAFLLCVCYFLSNKYFYTKKVKPNYKQNISVLIFLFGFGLVLGGISRLFVADVTDWYIIWSALGLINWEHVVALGVAAVVAEEILLRGYLQRVFDIYRLRVNWQLAAHGALFMLLHSGSGEISRLFFFFSSGVLLGSLRINLSTVLAPIGLHLGWNLWIFCFSHFVPFTSHISTISPMLQLRHWVIGTLFLVSSILLSKYCRWQKLHIHQ